MKINDAVVGRVRRIRFDPAGGRTLYEARLDRPGLIVRSDATAKAVAEFIGGAAIVLEDLGTAAAPLPDARHPVQLEAASAMLRQIQDALGYGSEQRQQFQQIFSAVAASAAKVEQITTTLAAELTDRQPFLLGRVKAAVADLRRASRDLAGMIAKLKLEVDLARSDSLLAKVHASADNVKQLSADAAGMMQKVRPDVEATVARIRGYTDRDVAELLVKFRQAATQIVAVAADMKVVSSTARDVVVLNRERIDETIANMKFVSANLNAAAKEIRREPWRLLYKPDARQIRRLNIYNAARAFSEGATELDDALARLTALRDARPAGVPANDPELVKIRRHIQATFEKFRQVEDALWKEVSQ